MTLDDGYVWEPTWESIDKLLSEGVNLSEFRQNNFICSRLTTDDFTPFLQRCREAEVPIEWLQDVLIGKPKTRRLNPEYWESKEADSIQATPNSLRVAYFLHRITNYDNSQIKQLKQLKVLEVGAGFGCFAELACRILPVTNYYFIDAPPMLALQKYYMTEAGYEVKCDFLTQNEEPPGQVDLIISSMSLGEMSMKELNKYLDLFRRKLVPETGLMYLIQRTKNIRTPWERFKFEGGPWKLETNAFLPLSHFTECFGRLLN